MPALSHFTRWEVAHLFRTSRRVLRHEICDVLLAREHTPSGRLLVVTSARTGNAVQRNKIRRRLKAIFYEEKYFERGYDCIIVIKKADVPFDEVRRIITMVFNKEVAT